MAERARSPRLLLLGGSMRATSCSLAALKIAAGMAQDSGWETQVADLRELELPTYRPEIQPHEFPFGTESILRLAELYRWADAHVWASPAYHGSVSGLFKNAIDFAELLSSDPLPYFQGRPVGLVAINDSTPLPTMYEMARELRAWVAPTRVAIPERLFTDGKISDSRTFSRLERMLGELGDFVRRPPLS